MPHKRSNNSFKSPKSPPRGKANASGVLVVVTTAATTIATTTAPSLATTVCAITTSVNASTALIASTAAIPTTSTADTQLSGVLPSAVKKKFAHFRKVCDYLDCSGDLVSSAPSPSIIADASTSAPTTMSNRNEQAETIALSSLSSNNSASSESLCPQDEIQQEFPTHSRRDSSEMSTSPVSFMCLSSSPSQSLPLSLPQTLSPPTAYTFGAPNRNTVDGAGDDANNEGDGMAAASSTNKSSTANVDCVGHAGFNELHPFQQKQQQKLQRDQIRRSATRKSVRFSSAKSRSSVQDALRIQRKAGKGSSKFSLLNSSDFESDATTAVTTSPTRHSSRRLAADAVTSAQTQANTLRMRNNDPDFIDTTPIVSAMPPHRAAAAAAAAAATATATGVSQAQSPAFVREIKPPQISVRFKSLTSEIPMQSESQSEALGNSSNATTNSTNVRIIHNVDSLVAKLANLGFPATDYSVKLGGTYGIRILPRTFALYSKLIKVLQLDSTLTFNTYQPRSERSFRVVVRGIHAQTPTKRITDELSGLGYTVRSVYNPKYRDRNCNDNTVGPRRTFAPNLFFISLAPGPTMNDNKKIFKLKTLCRYVVKVEWPQQNRRRNNNTVIKLPQCHRCQRFSHTARYCYHAPRCVKCGADHMTRTCFKPSSVPAKCANCGGEHTANYKGCQHYLDLVRLAQQKQRKGKRFASKRTPNQSRPKSRPQSESVPDSKSKNRSATKSVAINNSKSAPILSPSSAAASKQHRQKQQPKPIIPSHTVNNKKSQKQLPEQQHQQQPVNNPIKSRNARAKQRQRKNKLLKQQQGVSVAGPDANVKTGADLANSVAKPKKAKPPATAASTSAVPPPTVQSVRRPVRSATISPRERFAQVERLEVQRQQRQLQQFDGKPVSRQQIVDMQQRKLETTFQDVFRNSTLLKRTPELPSSSTDAQQQQQAHQQQQQPSQQSQQQPQPMLVDQAAEPSCADAIGGVVANNNSTELSMLVNMLQMQQQQMTQMHRQFEEMQQIVAGIVRHSASATVSNSPTPSPQHG